jgi:carbamoyltransferase
MQVLGIGDHISCGSALVKDGKVLSAINDERLVREKMVFGFPRESIKAIMDMHGVTAKDVDAIAIGTQNQHFYDHYVDFKDGWFGLDRGTYKKTLFTLASKFARYGEQLPLLQNIYYGLRQPSFARRRGGLKRLLRDEFGFDCPISFLDHHFCHAASAYYTSGMKESTVVTLDGGGDAKSGKIFGARDGKFQELHAISTYDSLGTFYSYVTQLCGFKAGRHEGKITGLAAYGEPIYMRELKSLLDAYGGTLHNDGHVFFYSALEELEKILPADFSHRDLAATVQIHSEEMVQHIVDHWVKETGYADVSLAGGVFANVKINQRVHELPCVNSVYVHPGMSDEGIPLGAAISMYYAMSGAKYVPEFESMHHVYLGPEYTDAEIGEELKKNGVEATFHEEVEPEIARILADGKVVARFNGRMEYGPRALGNRTILYQPNDPTVNYWMNESLSRTEFMPFAPVVMADYAEKCFKNIKGAEDTARFMTITFDCTEWMAGKCPGVVHIDNTARPQLVNERDNESMYRILAEYNKLTGIPALINTSFNMHEEPIVCSPYDAIRAFKLGKLDYLAIGNWIAKNPDPQPRINNSARFDSYLDRRGVVKNGARPKIVEKETELSAAAR